jgi:AAA+ ATPase superfamily predicted ATPase
MIRKFVNRKEELEFLEREFMDTGLKVIILYGRRRVGKTELINQFCKDKPHIYFLADKRGTAINAREFAANSARYFNDITPEVRNFDDAFIYILKRTEDRKLIVTIDEFAYLVEKDDSIPSVFQKIVDVHLKGANTYLILCGSSISMMEGILGYRSPLYGRRTGQWKVTPLRFKDSWSFLPRYSLEEFIEAFSVVGNIPAYLLQFDDSADIYENIEKGILRRGNPLYEEVEFILRAELREPSVYMSVVEAIANGVTKVTEIANRCYINAKDIPKYLQVLQRLQLVQRVVPITERKTKTKKAIYQISDNFFRFWFRFVYPNRSDVEGGEVDRALSKIRAEFNLYVGRIFEQVCREFLEEVNHRAGLPFHFTKIGNWWGHFREDGVRKEIEIDIVALNEDTRDILFAECKWLNKKVGINTYHNLMEKSTRVEWHLDKRKEYFALFSKAGFTPELKKENVILFDLKEIEKHLKS